MDEGQARGGFRCAEEGRVPSESQKALEAVYKAGGKMGTVGSGGGLTFGAHKYSLWIFQNLVMVVLASFGGLKLPMTL